MPYYECPRCGSTDSYIGTEIRQNVSGSGGGGGGGGGGFTPPPTAKLNEKGRFLYYEHHTPTPDAPIHIDPIHIDPIHINPIEIRTDHIEFNVIKCRKDDTILSEKDKRFTKEEIEEKRKKEEEKRKKEEEKRNKERRKAYENLTNVELSFAFVLFAYLGLVLFFCSPILQAINVSIDDELAKKFSAMGFLIAVFSVVLSASSLYENIDASDRSEESILLAKKFDYKLWLTAVIFLFPLSATIGWYYYDAFSSSQSLLYSLWCFIWFIFGLIATIISIYLILWGILDFEEFKDKNPKRKYFRSTCPFCESDFRAAYKYPNQSYTCVCGNRMRLNPS